MKKLNVLLSGLLLSLLLLCFFEKANAQCGNRNQYLIELHTLLSDEILSVSGGSTIFNRVDIRTDANVTTLYINQQVYPVNGNTLLTLTLPEGVNTFTVVDAGGRTAENNIKVRSLSNIEYKAPDAVWDIAGSYTPTCTGCVPDVNGGLAKAYIKYANPDKKLRKVLVFVEGIDFDRDSITDPDNQCRAIRYGDFGWDVFYMGHKVDTSWDFIRLMPGTREAI